MSKEKVKIASAIEKEWNGKKFLSITLADGRTGSSNDMDLKNHVEKEIEVEVKPAKEYQGVQQYFFNLPKQDNSGGKNFPKKDWVFEKRRIALECASLVHSHQPESMGKATEVITSADKFLEWLNKQ